MAATLLLSASSGFAMDIKSLWNFADPAAEAAAARPYFARAHALVAGCRR